MSIYGELMKLNEARPTPQVPSSEANSAAKPQPHQPALSPLPEEPKPNGTRKTIAKTQQEKPRHHAIVIPRHHDTMKPRYRDTTIETIRAAVKVFGKEAATHRFTVEEKKALRDIVYAYEVQGIRTSENEISRIGVNFLVEDYRQNGENSILHQVLQALNG